MIAFRNGITKYWQFISTLHCLFRLLHASRPVSAESHGGDCTSVTLTTTVTATVSVISQTS